MTRQTETVCEICAERARADHVVNGFSYFRCTRCGHLFVDPKPPLPELKAYYENASFYAHAQAQSERLEHQSTRRSQELFRLASVVAPIPTLLDVGCASGIFLAAASRAGFEVEGVELSPVLAAETRSKGLRVHVAEFESLSLSEEFSVVTSWEVIEHTISPRDYFRQLVNRTVRGGYIAISTPLANGIPARLLGKRFPMLCPPEHLSLFTRDSLLELGKSFQLIPVSFRSFSGLEADNIARGIARFLLGRATLATRWPVQLAARALVPAAVLTDWVGLGTEMEMIFQKP